MRGLVRSVIRLVLLGSVIKLMALAAERLVTEIDEKGGDEFDLLAAADGREFASTAQALRWGRVRVVIGGVDLDLRRARLSPEGADVDLLVVAGGARVLVGEGWRVVVSHRGVAGGVAIDVPDGPPGAPELRLHLQVVGGGVAVATEPSSRHVVDQAGDPA